MPGIYLKIRAGVKRLREVYISKRIEEILIKNDAEVADISRNMWRDYTITNIPVAAIEPVFYAMEQEPGFEPYLHPED